MNKRVLVLTLLSAATAAAQPAATPASAPQPPGYQPTVEASAAPAAPPPDAGPPEPKFGDFNAGGQARFPNGPDEMGQFASFNWVAADIKGRFYLLKTVTVNANIPLAVKKPDTIDMGMTDPKLFGGFTLNLDARLPIKKGALPMMKFDTDIGAVLTFGYMRDGAMLLSEKDYPKFVGDLQPGFSGALVTKIKLGSVLDFSLLPAWVYQAGAMESSEAIQVPLALGIGLGKLLKLNLELGIYTGDDYSLRARNGGRIATGASLDVRISHILIHAGAGAASLLVDPAGVYPTVSDSFYVDLNAKYVK
jgi:hypothetical protein